MAPVEPGSRWGFAFPGALRDELTAFALDGRKVVTTGLLVEYELDADPVPRPGDRSVLLDSSDRPIAIVESVVVKQVRLADVEDADAIDEGEGYADAAAFRASHERFWGGYVEELRARLGDPSFAITDDTQVVVERFRIVGLLDADGRAFDPPVRPAYADDRRAVDAFLAEHGADLVARGGELVDARRHPALIAERDGELAGVLTWLLADGELEALTLHTADQWRGAGTALLSAARRVAEASGARRLWLVTTNDNLDALRFYQRRGMRLVAVRPGAVDRSRAALKPAIPETGSFGIPLRDELELEIRLDPSELTLPEARGLSSGHEAACGGSHRPSASMDLAPGERSMDPRSHRSLLL